MTPRWQISPASSTAYRSSRSVRPRSRCRRRAVRGVLESSGIFLFSPARLRGALRRPFGSRRTAAQGSVRGRSDAGGAEGAGGEIVGGVRTGVEGAVGAGRAVAPNRPVGSGRLGQFAGDTGV